MDLAALLKRHTQPHHGLIAIEKISLCYLLFTLVLLVAFHGRIGDISNPITNRAIILAGTFILCALYRWLPCRLLYIVRIFFQLGWLGYWYPDIYNIVKIMPNLDPFFAKTDQFIFNCQPALEFSKAFSGDFWSELFNMGYASYFPIIITVPLWALLFCFKRFERTATVMFCSFMLYYLVYLFLQVAGPQFYYPVVGIENIVAGAFPPVGDYFLHHAELTVSHADSGFFGATVDALHGSERPIAAFPSSHVGLSSVLIWLAYKLSRRLALVILPFYVILCLSTVYIGAHYAIDVIFGWITAVLFYLASSIIYNSLKQQDISL